MGDEKLGCEHYDRGCQLLCPDCDEFFWCRHCHNEIYENHLDPKKAHKMDRTRVKKIKCGMCDTVQGIRKKCKVCGLKFGKYTCKDCRFYDNEDKGQFHCDKCGICRVGGKDNYFHCDKCNACLSIKMKDNHKCIDETLKINCPICLEYLMDSTEPSNIMKCGHSIHVKCQDELLKSGQTKCPLCNESMVDMKEQWKQTDHIIRQSPMPEIYKDWKVKVLCSDCHNESENNYHVIGIKCLSCGGYNTRRIGTETPPRDDS